MERATATSSFQNNASVWAAPAVMMPPWLMRSLRPVWCPPRKWERQSCAPAGWGRRAASTCHLRASTTDTRPGRGKARLGQRPRHDSPPTSRDKKGNNDALLARSVTAPCRGVLGRQTVVRVAIGIAPSRGRAPELTSESGHRVGAWPGQSARLSSTHSPRRARDPARLRSGPLGSGS
jgi:hypothetical protein